MGRFSDFWMEFKGEYVKDIRLIVGGISNQIKQTVAILAKDLLKVKDYKGLTNDKKSQ